MSKEILNNDFFINEFGMNSNRVFVAIGDFVVQAANQKSQLPTFSKMLKMLTNDDVKDQFKLNSLGETERMVFELGNKMAEKDNVIIRVLASSELDLLFACGVGYVDSSKLELVMIGKNENIDLHKVKLVSSVEINKEIVEFIETFDHSNYREFARKVIQHRKKGAEIGSFPGIVSKVNQIGLIRGCSFTDEVDLKMIEPVDEVKLIACPSKPENDKLTISTNTKINKMLNVFDFYRAIALKSRTRLSYRSLQDELKLVES